MDVSEFRDFLFLRWEIIPTGKGYYGLLRETSNLIKKIEV